MPFVSICIPTYNGASYLKACLDSALAQTYSDFEVLVLDDQSTDHSLQIAQNYAMRDPRVRVECNKENLGLVRNWNRCALLARGEWIKFLFQDDLLEPNCLEKMLEVSDSNTSMVVCRRNFIFEDDSSELKDVFQRYIHSYNMDKIFPDETAISAERFCKAVLDNLCENFVGEPTAVLLHRSVFNRFGLFNPHLISICDLEYWIRVGSHTGLTYVPETLAHFRRHYKGATFKDEKSRRFRLYLDKPICLYNFVFDPLYAPLRLYASRCQPPVNLNQLFAGKVKDAWKVARQATGDRLNPDPSQLEEMKEISRLFPGFRIVKKIPLSVRFSKYRWKIQNFVSNHF